ncbi:response regulator [Candidatus Chlorohelix sp.]|uniref:response regulator n=1 Tax=Candidatus Chlorohelix sp. TaxID=3139201 RepID=UPI003059409D
MSKSSKQLYTTTILLIENDNSSRNVMRVLLQKLAGQPVQIYDTSDGDEALKLFREKQPQIVFTDLIHPGLDGCSLIERMRHLNPYVFIVVCSSVELIWEVRGYNFFLEKPFATADFQRVIHAGLEHAEDLMAISGDKQLKAV